MSRICSKEWVFTKIFEMVIGGGTQIRSYLTLPQSFNVPSIILCTDFNLLEYEPRISHVDSALYGT